MDPQNFAGGHYRAALQQTTEGERDYVLRHGNPEVPPASQSVPR